MDRNGMVFHGVLYEHGDTVNITFRDGYVMQAKVLEITESTFTIDAGDGPITYSIHGIYSIKTFQ